MSISSLLILNILICVESFKKTVYILFSEIIAYGFLWESKMHLLCF